MLILDEYLTQHGLTLEIFCKALRLEEKSLADENIHIKVIQSQKKHGTFWEMRAFLTETFSAQIGINGYSEESILKTIRTLQDAAKEESTGDKRKKIPGRWPEAKHFFFLWLKKQLPKQQKKQLKKQETKYTPEEKTSKNLEFYVNKILTAQSSVFSLKILDELASFLEERLKKTQLASKKNDLQEQLKIVSAAICFKKVKNFKNVVVSYLQRHREIEYYNAQNQMCLKLLFKPDKIEFLGITFSNFQLQQFLSLRKWEIQKKERALYIKKTRELWDGIPEEYKAKIKKLKNLVPQNWDILYTLSYEHREFLSENLKDKEFSFRPRRVESQKDMNEWVSMMLDSIEKEMQKPSPVNNVILEILSLIHSTPKYGVKTYALWLGKSQSIMLEKKKLDPAFRGKLSGYKTDQIVTEIEKLIRMDWMEIVPVGSHHLPVVKLTDKGKQSLESLLYKQKEAGVVPVLEKPESAEPKLPVAPKIYSYYELLQDIENSKKESWIVFLKQENIGSEIESWESSRIEYLCNLLEQKIPGWQIPLRWEIAMHPKKNKPLEGLLEQ